MGPGILSKFLHKLEVAGVPHWFRSSFRDWAGELPHIPMLEAEMVLALSRSAVGVASFMARDLFEQRRPIMQEWGDIVTETIGPVVPAIPSSQ